MTTSNPQQPFRLSVIIPTYNRRTLVERAVKSVLAQEDPISTEIIVADDGSRDGTKDHLDSIFFDAVQSRKLRVIECKRSGDPGATRNQGVEASSGTFLAFLDSDDYWRPGRLQWLEPLLSKKDFILTPTEYPGESSDWLQTYLRINLGHTSSIVVRRTLFNSVGGFPQGYFGILLPKRLPGFEDYEFLLKCFCKLAHPEQNQRILVAKNQHVVIEHQQSGSGRMALKSQMLRETMTLMRIASILPKRYWPLLSRRIAGAGKAMVLGR